MVYQSLFFMKLKELSSFLGHFLVFFLSNSAVWLLFRLKLVKACIGKIPMCTFTHNFDIKMVIVEKHPFKYYHLTLCILVVLVFYYNHNMFLIQESNNIFMIINIFPSLYVFPNSSTFILWHVYSYYQNPAIPKNHTFWNFFLSWLFFPFHPFIQLAQDVPSHAPF